ncbi:MAG: NAD(P)-dependent oxidoreductase [Polyangiales bacterium]
MDRLPDLLLCMRTPRKPHAKPCAIAPDNMRVLVTGGSGFLGSHAADQLAREGHTVRCLVRKSSNTTFLKSISGVELAYGAVEDKDAVATACDGVDAILHSAGLVKAKRPQDFVATNVDGTRNLLEVAFDRRSHIQRFVYVSSLAAHGPSLDGNAIAFDRDPTPVTEYGRSKLAAERMVNAAKDDLSVTVIRPPAIYGPRDNEMFAFFEAVWKGFLPILGDGSQRLSIIFGADAASACVKALTVPHDSGRAYYIEDGSIYTQPQMADGIEKALGKKAYRVNVPIRVVRLASYGSQLYGRMFDKAVMLTPDKVNELGAPHWVCSADPIRKDLGWAPLTQWDEGARITATWYRDSGWIR